MARNLVLKSYLQNYRRGFPGSGQTDLVRIIDPWQDIARRTHHSPREVDNYVGTF